MKRSLKQIILLTSLITTPLFSADEKIQVELQNAINIGNQEKVDSLITAGADISDASLLRNIISEGYGSTDSMVMHILRKEIDFTTPDWNTPLPFRSNSVEILSFMYDNDLSPEILDENRRTLLIDCLIPHRYNPELAKLHISKGVSINHEDIKGATALSEAIQKADTAIVSLLVKHGADLNRKNSYGISPILFCDSISYDRRSSEKRELIRNHLVALGAEPIKPENYELIEAVKEGNSEKEIRSLVKAGADINFVNNQGESALFCAIKSKNDSLASLLISMGAELNNYNTYNYSPLMIAVREKNSTLIKQLVEAGANVNFKTPDGKTTLFYCSDTARSEIFSYLVKQGGDITVIDNAGVSLLFPAARKGNLPLVASLLEQGVNCNLRTSVSTTYNSKGATAISGALERRNFEIIKTLIDAGADSKSITEGFANSFGPFYGSANHRNRPYTIEFVEYLLKNGLDPQKYPKFSNRALLNIIKYSKGDHQYELLKLFSSHGADLSQIRNGLKEIFIAHDSNMKSAELLLDHGADPFTTIYGNTLLFHLPANLISRSVTEPDSLSLAVLNKLLAKGVDVNARNDSGVTALSYYADQYNRGKHYRSPLRFYDIITSLGYSVDLNTIDNSGNTALMELSMEPYSYSTKIDRNIHRELIRRGADATIQNSEGLYAFQMREYGTFEHPASAAIAYGKDTHVPQRNDSLNFFVDAGRDYSFEIRKGWKKDPYNSRPGVNLRNREAPGSEFSIQNVYKGFKDSYKDFESMLKSLESQLRKFEDVTYEQKKISQSEDIKQVEINYRYSAYGKKYFERLICVDLSEDHFLIFTLRTKNSEEEFLRFSKELSELQKSLKHHRKKKWFAANRKTKELTINDKEGNLFSSGKILQSHTGETIYIKDYREYFPNGSVKLVTEKQQGLSHGSHVEYFENGSVRISGSFYKGRKTGAWITYDEKGTVKRKKEFPGRV